MHRITLNCPAKRLFQQLLAIRVLIGVGPVPIGALSYDPPGTGGVTLDAYSQPVKGLLQIPNASRHHMELDTAKIEKEEEVRV